MDAKEIHAYGEFDFSLRRHEEYCLAFIRE